ncbi:MAG: universal stress protein [Thermoproteota archaeon]|jgi:nucleotide-binding universal stress UspA family protein|nr:universal stress protein [Thermoproteota archaeon]
MAQLRKFSKVLVAVDGSEYSMNAAEYAISITRQFGSELIALHVITSDVSTVASAFLPQMEEIKKNAQEYFDKIRRKGEEASGDIQLRTELISSPSVVGGIIEFAEKENIDLIVVGTKGRSGLKRLLLGSVASGIVNYAHCPVMIVK